MAKVVDEMRSCIEGWCKHLRYESGNFKCRHPEVVYFPTAKEACNLSDWASCPLNKKEAV